MLKRKKAMSRAQRNNMEVMVLAMYDRSILGLLFGTTNSSWDFNRRNSQAQSQKQAQRTTWYSQKPERSKETLGYKYN